MGIRKLIVEGPVSLRGEIKVSGAKNAVLPILAASLLTDGETILHNVPKLRDVETMVQLLRVLGCDVKEDYPVLKIRPIDTSKYEAPYEIVRTMRGSFCVLGALLGRRRKARVSLPGGCVIGVRPVDLHLKGLAALGAGIEIEAGYVIAEANRLRGSSIYLGGMFGSSVLATANVMMAAVLARGETIIENAACEPEIYDLAKFLKKMGADIEGAGTPWIRINGVKTLHGCEHRIIPDRIEAGTFIIGAAMTRGDVVVKNAVPDHLGAVLDVLRRSGVGIKVYKDDNIIRICQRRGLVAQNIATLPYPGFPTDLQAQFMAMMTISRGTSVITERIYPDRFMHVPELNRMGANIKREGPYAVVQGVKELKGAPVMASDLRASAALVLAGLAAEGRTDISRIYHLERGYEALEEKLSSLGAKIWQEIEE